ncbi:MAG: [FeFe] hydrogenase H-cluster maturation GTPase HydF [Blautia sp.]|nr:[FeFe] hydrogenase H-cluster maturation GTPase HydF [Blautia sp.]
MSLNSTPSSERIHIGFFGMRNAGKSSLVNAVTGQELSVVSDVKGTTTDPVKKAMELLPLGPVVIIDTPGIDDEGELGEKRIKKAQETLAKIDIAVLVTDAEKGLCGPDRELIRLFEERKLPYIIACTKADLLADNIPLGEKVPSASAAAEGATHENNTLLVSAKTGENIDLLKEKLGAFAGKLKNSKKLVADLLSPGDMVVLVIPIDESAPKGRLILPQQQVMRDVLDSHCSFAACQDTDLKETLASLGKKPRLVITDSQAFGRVSKNTPDDILLTSFSILFARYKGSLETLVRGAAKLSKLKDGDKVLISEGCTHHRQCNDIGTVKMPGWIEQFSGIKPQYVFSSGNGFPDDLSEFALIVHCGGCMLNEKEMQYRIARANAAGVPIVNYGVAIAEMHGILRRSLEIFPEILKILNDLS